jgi:hypothetical protein
MRSPSGFSDGNNLMRIIKLVIISIVSLLLIITIISVFIPSHVSISRAVHINSPKEKVMPQLADPTNWKNWYPDLDSAKYIYVGGIVKGLILNEKKGQSIIITTLKDDEVVALYNLPNKKITATWQVISSGDSSVTVQWNMDFYLHWYPWEKFSSFVFERIYHPQLQRGLANLKTFLEKG